MCRGCRPDHLPLHRLLHYHLLLDGLLHYHLLLHRLLHNHLLLYGLRHHHLRLYGSRIQSLSLRHMRDPHKAEVSWPPLCDSKHANKVG